MGIRAPVKIRPERPADADAIGDVTQRAFLAAPHRSGTEASIVAALRHAGALSVSLVAELDGRVVGHIAFSPVQVSDGSSGWHGLGPLSVDPAAQRGGIGSALAAEGLERLRRLGARGCVLLGDPQFYGRFGFAATPGLVLPGLPAEYFLALPLGAAPAQGQVKYHAAFDIEPSADAAAGPA